VGLKRRRPGRRWHAVRQPQSNQRGIETPSAPAALPARRAGLNRTSVGLKLHLHVPEAVGRVEDEPQSNQRGIETGLRSADPFFLQEPQSNQRGIETAARTEARNALRACLNRTSVGLKRRWRCRPGSPPGRASIEPAWD